MRGSSRGTKSDQKSACCDEHCASEPYSDGAFAEGSESEDELDQIFSLDPSFRQVAQSLKALQRMLEPITPTHARCIVPTRLPLEEAIVPRKEAKERGGYGGYDEEDYDDEDDDYYEARTAHQQEAELNKHRGQLYDGLHIMHARHYAEKEEADRRNVPLVSAMPSGLCPLACGHLVCMHCVRESTKSEQDRFDPGDPVVCPRCNAETLVLPLTPATLLAWSVGPTAYFQTDSSTRCTGCELPFDAPYTTTTTTTSTSATTPHTTAAHLAASGSTNSTSSTVPGSTLVPALHAVAEDSLTYMLRQQRRQKQEEEEQKHKQQQGGGTGGEYPGSLIYTDEYDRYVVMDALRGRRPRCQLGSCRSFADSYCTACNMLFCAACEHEVHSMRLFEHHRKGERDRVVPWELHEAAVPRCRRHNMPLTRFNQRRFKLYCDICCAEADTPPQDLLDPTAGASEVFHHLFCALAALSSGIAELQSHLHLLNARLRYLDSVKADSLKYLLPLYNAVLREEKAKKKLRTHQQQQLRQQIQQALRQQTPTESDTQEEVHKEEEEEHEEEEEGEDNEPVDADVAAAVKMRLKPVLRGCLSYPAASRLFHETVRAALRDVLLGALVVHHEAMHMKAHMWHSKFSLEQYLEALHMCRQYAAACLFARRVPFPTTQLFHFDQLPADFLSRPPSARVPLVCVPDVPAPVLLDTSCTDTTMDTNVVVPPALALNSSYWTQSVLCGEAAFQVVLVAQYLRQPGERGTSTQVFQRACELDKMSDHARGLPPGAEERSAAFVVPAMQQLTTKHEVRVCAALHISGLRPGSSYTVLVRTLVDKNQACSEFSKPLTFVTSTRVRAPPEVFDDDATGTAAPAASSSSAVAPAEDLKGVHISTKDLGFDLDDEEDEGDDEEHCGNDDLTPIKPKLMKSTAAPPPLPKPPTQPA